MSSSRSIAPRAGCSIHRHQEPSHGDQRAQLSEVAKAAPFQSRTIRTDNGAEFTDRLFGSRAKLPSGQHEFGRLCAQLQIEHRLTQPKTPQTKGMVDRSNGRLARVLRTHRFNSREDLAAVLHAIFGCTTSTWHRRRSSVSPLDAMKRWREARPELFVRSVRNHPAPDTY